MRSPKGREGEEEGTGGGHTASNRDVHPATRWLKAAVAHRRPQSHPVLDGGSSCRFTLLRSKVSSLAGLGARRGCSESAGSSDDSPAVSVREMNAVSLQSLELLGIKVATKSPSRSSACKVAFEEQSDASDAFGSASLPCDGRQLLQKYSADISLRRVFAYNIKH